MTKQTFEAELARIVAGQCRDPFGILGPKKGGAGIDLTVFLPYATGVKVLLGKREIDMQPRGDGLFFLSDAATAEDLAPGAYKLKIDWSGVSQVIVDPYAFGPLLSDYDIFLFRQGRLFRMADSFGANSCEFSGEKGVLFAVWAPDAHCVSVVGDFNGWNPCRHPMRLRIEAGVWELFLPGVEAGARYKFAITGYGGKRIPWKADPLAKMAEPAPLTASIVAAPPQIAWSDAGWIEDRVKTQAPDAPLSFYEVHIESWLRGQFECPVSWDGAIDRLIPYVVEMGFTHIELMPIMEHPFGGSWGYQPLGLFAPTSRLGGPDDFARFIDACHRAGIGVALDWVPGHFPNDAYGLVSFDGNPLYEHADPREGFHRDWNTLIYNFGRHEVRNFLIASALYWIETFHVDALRVDAVASMLYRDYSRSEGEWIPNVYGGRENFEAIGFLREMNGVLAERCPGAITIAEESTAFPGVTTSVEYGGLGFHYKWNMGWMNDTLHYLARDPIYRKWHHNDLLFSICYAFSETFVLPLSHDEVVHGKGALVNKLPGDEWRRHAQLRLLYGYMWTHPGKKLLFMGCELAQDTEWNHDTGFPWPHPFNLLKNGMRRWVRDLNALYRAYPAMHRLDASYEGFNWIVTDDHENCVIGYRRSIGQREKDIVVVLNFTPEPRFSYRIGAAFKGAWRELLNSDAEVYGGSGLGNFGGGETEDIPSHGDAQSIVLTLPPFGVVVLAAEEKAPVLSLPKNSAAG
ncbi:1,4-alpha-glucan branching protein GlgB [uncultured Rhodoblastus sp.]|uniref:1,4-alpha-glucan branching protein GlgB n=1 Tax=uncultured Rhodoblastus sp. TaxID=543037 RepID=UPI0025D85214|nr:1,4-alpha-glucan branching protein GlgB [uncultured Rhodoblastus sp.]